MAEPRYEAVADSYGVGPDDYSLSATRVLLELVGSVTGMRVLDLACGHGLISREMARRGATVVGVDLAQGLIGRARNAEVAAPLGVRYVRGDVASLETLKGEVFDLVVCNFGLSDIDDLAGTCATVARLLTVGDRFVFSILHPCFPGVADVSGSWPPGARYYDEGWWRADGKLSALRRVVGANHRMLSTYVNTLRRHNLAVQQMVEPPPSGSWATERAGADALPVFLVVLSELDRPSISICDGS